jgi:hypothetical protein
MIVEIFGIDGSLSGRAEVGSTRTGVAGGCRAALDESSRQEIKPAQKQTTASEAASAKYPPRRVIAAPSSGLEDRRSAARSNDATTVSTLRSIKMEETDKDSCLSLPSPVFVAGVRERGRSRRFSTAANPNWCADLQIQSSAAVYPPVENQPTRFRERVEGAVRE